MPPGGGAALPPRRLNPVEGATWITNYVPRSGLERTKQALDVFLAGPPAAGDTKPTRVRNVADHDSCFVEPHSLLVRGASCNERDQARLVRGGHDFVTGIDQPPATVGNELSNPLVAPLRRRLERREQPGQRPGCVPDGV